MEPRARKLNADTGVLPARARLVGSVAAVTASRSCDILGPYSVTRLLRRVVHGLSWVPPASLRPKRLGC